MNVCSKGRWGEHLAELSHPEQHSLLNKEALGQSVLISADTLLLVSTGLGTKNKRVNKSWAH